MKASQWEELAPANWAESLTFSLLRWRWSVFSCLSAPTPPPPPPLKSSTNENWVKFCLLVLSIPQCDAARCRKRYCLWLNNTGCTETEELGFYSSSVHSREQLLAIDVFLLGYCYCRFNAETLWDLCWKWIRISDDPDAIMTSTSSARHSFYVHRAHIHGTMNWPLHSHKVKAVTHTVNWPARHFWRQRYQRDVLNVGSPVPLARAHSWLVYRPMSLIRERYALVT